MSEVEAKIFRRFPLVRERLAVYESSSLERQCIYRVALVRIILS